MCSHELPEWTLEDAYGHVDSPVFLAEYQRIEDIIQCLKSMVDYHEDFHLAKWLPVYEEGFNRVSSLIAFCRCLVSQNVNDSKVPPVAARIQMLANTLEQAATPIFDALLALPENDVRWQLPELTHWKFTTEQKRNSWLRSLTSSQQQQFSMLASSNFYPLNTMFSHLNKQLKVQAVTCEGEDHVLTLAQCQGVMKGNPDATLRATTFAGMNSFYQRNADLYADILNQLNGFRLAQFTTAGIDYLTPSLEQNRISHDALKMMFNCLHQRVDEIRKSVSLRSSHLGTAKMAACDLMAPAPTVAPKDIPYSESLANICAGVGQLSSELPDFIKMMLDKHWLEARVSTSKTGGAFYTRFNQLKQPRVFTSYMGTFAHQIQQAHEIGHAWHYWIMRDLPSIETEFPMTLAEVASTFNEAMVRHYLLDKDKSQSFQFSVLWQELKSVSNFLLNIPVRYEFETQFLKQRQTHILTTEQINQLMNTAWHKWYGETTSESDLYLWASKQHFYKTDQYIYNYPYTVGYLISQGLMQQRQQRGNNFITCYRELLRDSGRLSVDDLIAKHLGYDITQPDFWHQCINMAMSHVDTFEKNFNYNDLKG